jgi:hypothetical protein
MAPINSRERRLLKKALSRSRACATPAELAGVADGSLSALDVARITGHIAKCPRCKTELSLLETFERESPRPSEEGTVSWLSSRLERQFANEGFAKARSDRDSWWPRLLTSSAVNRAGFALAAAMLVIAVATGLRERRPPGILPPTGGETVFRSGGLTGLSPTGDVDQPPAALRWEPVPTAASYVLRVMEVDRTQLWSVETSEPGALLPPAAQARFVPGKLLLWEVTAKDATGRSLSSSGTQRLRVRVQAK